MDETTAVQNLADVSNLLEQAVETICRGEAFCPGFADDWLYSLGAVVELARLSGDGAQGDLNRAEAFLAGVGRRVDAGDEVVLTAEHLEALQSLQGLERMGRPVAETLDREEGRLYTLINPVHFQSNTVLCENDRGVYEDPWAALADLGVVKRESQNLHIYLACLTPAEAVIAQTEAIQPSGQGDVEGAITLDRQAEYDQLVALAWEALDKLGIADGIVDPYEDGTPFCADLCEALHDLLWENWRMANER